jgi:hypothetical protein
MARRGVVTIVGWLRAGAFSDVVPARIDRQGEQAVFTDDGAARASSVQALRTCAGSDNSRPSGLLADGADACSR